MPVVEGLLTLEELGVWRDHGLLLSASRLVVPDKSCTTILLKSGAGRSSLAYALAGLPLLVSRLSLTGRGAFRLGPRVDLSAAYWTEKAALVPQDYFRYLTELRVSDELLFALENISVPRHEADLRVQRAARLLGIDALLDRNPLTLSGGEVQRLGIAVAISTTPELLVLDEPFAELDAGMLAILEELLIHTLPAEGIATCIITAGVTRAFVEGTQIVTSDRGHLSSNTRRSVDELETLDGIYLIHARGAERGRGGRKPAGSQADPSRVPLISVVNLTFTYSRARPPALKEITFDLWRGEMVALTGPNGAGKSTLLALLLGFENLAPGCVIADGRVDIHRQPRYLRDRSGIAFQTYHHSFLGDTIREELALAFNARILLARVTETEPAYAAASIDEIIDRFNLGEVATEVIDNVPTSPRRLLAVATALLQARDLIVLDEPTAGLDGNGRRILLNEMTRLRKESLLGLIVSHDREFVTATCGVEMHIRDGKLAEVRSGEQIGFHQGLGLSS
jgi:energy-coupling factor transport system ATP-binding protein